MKKIKNAICCFLIITVIVTTFLTGCSCSLFKTETYVTRGEWIKMLSKHFSLSTSETEAPYFSDVQPENEIFSFVQTCADWGIIEREEKFHPNSKANRKFVAVSAATAADWSYSGDILDSLVYEGILYSADEDYLSEKMTQSECEEIIEWAVNIYLRTQFDEYDANILKDNVVFYTYLNNKDIIIDGSIVKISADVDECRSVGDIIVTPATKEHPGGIARKIVSVEHKGKYYSYETTEPELYEVYETLEFSTVAIPDSISCFVPEEGVEVVEYIQATENRNQSDTSPVQKLGATNNASIENLNFGAGFTLEVNLSNSGPKLSSDFSYGMAEIEAAFSPDSEVADFMSMTGCQITETGSFNEITHNGKPIPLHYVDKYTSGYEIIGTISLSNIYAEIESKGFIDSCNIALHCDFEQSIAVKGVIREEITLGNIYIPTGCPGIYARFELVLQFDFNGELSVTAKTETISKATYKKGNGVKFGSEKKDESSLQACISGSINVIGRATAEALGIDLIDIGVSVGLGFDAGATLTYAAKQVDTGELYTIPEGTVLSDGYIEQYCLCSEVNVYSPLISIILSNSETSLSTKCGLTHTINIVGKDEDSAWFKASKITLHLEAGKGWVDKCTLYSLKELTEQTKYSEDQDENNPNEYQEDDTATETISEKQVAEILTDGSTWSISGSIRQAGQYKLYVDFGIDNTVAYEVYNKTDDRTECILTGTYSIAPYDEYDGGYLVAMQFTDYCDCEIVYSMDTAAPDYLYYYSQKDVPFSVSFVSPELEYLWSSGD